jgi:uncharacterized protein YwgA
MNRIFFKDEKKCYEFFENVKEATSTKSWNDFGKLIKTNRAMISNYRKGRLCIPKDRFERLLNYLNTTRKKYFLSMAEKKEENWGQILGGKKAYAINKEVFKKGRLKGAEIRKLQYKYDFDVNMPLSNELCEFVGCFIGDGFTNKYQNACQIQITGDRKLDADYYTHLKSICKDLFGIYPKIVEKDGWIRLNMYSKRLFEMLTKRFKFPAGQKSFSVVIPPEIYDGKKELLNYTLRGIFDTDGGVGLDKRQIYKKPYIRINYTSVSKGLIKQVHQILKDYGINHSVHERRTGLMIQINGAENVKKFMSKIGFSNKRHLDKIKVFL